MYAARDGEVAVGEAVAGFSERRPVTDRAKLYPPIDLRRRGCLSPHGTSIYENMNSSRPETSVAKTRDGSGPSGAGFKGDDGSICGKYWKKQQFRPQLP